MAQLQINIFDEIGGWGFTFNSLTDQLKGFKGQRIKVPINSFGGSVFEGMAIYNTLLGRSEFIEAHIVGYAMSMGSVIAMAADEVTMPENGYFMIHNPVNAEYGDADDMESMSGVLRMITDDLANIYAKKTGLTVNKVKKMMKAETWLNAKEAKKMGFVDRLTKGANFEASFKPEQIANYHNIPDNLKNNIMSTFNLKEWAKNLFGDEMPSNKDEADKILAEKTKPEPINIAESEDFKALQTSVQNAAKASDVSDLKGNFDEFATTIGENVTALADAIKTLSGEVKNLKEDTTEVKEEVTVKDDAATEKIKALTAELNKLKGQASGKKAETVEDAVTIPAEGKEDKEVVKAENATGFLNSYLKGETGNLN